MAAGICVEKSHQKNYETHTQSKTRGYHFVHLSSTSCHTWGYR